MRHNNSSLKNHIYNRDNLKKINKQHLYCPNNLCRLNSHKSLNKM